MDTNCLVVVVVVFKYITEIAIQVFQTAKVFQGCIYGHQRVMQIGGPVKKCNVLTHTCLSIGGVCVGVMVLNESIHVKFW